jgi:predicted nucleotidyltransferase
MSPSADSLQQKKLRETLAPLTDALHEQLGERLVAIVLFGSRARGEADAESDWDLLVIAEGLPPKVFDRHLFIKQLLPQTWRGVTSALAKTPEEFDSAIQSIYLDIAVDGIILTDKKNYMADRLALLNRQLESQGLYRVREGGDMLWRWAAAPRDEWSFEWNGLPT